MKIGDWYCLKCNFLIYRPKTVCYKCGSSKDDKLHKESRLDFKQQLKDLDALDEANRIAELNRIKVPCRHNSDKKYCWKCN